MDDSMWKYEYEVSQERLKNQQAEIKKLRDLMNRIITEPHELCDIKNMIKGALHDSQTDNI